MKQLTQQQLDAEVDAILRKLAEDDSLAVLTSDNGLELAKLEQQTDADRRARARRDFARKVVR